MYGKTNAAGGGGSFVTSSDAVLYVKAPTGSTVTITKNGATKTGIGFASETVGTSVYLFPIKSALFDNNTWTVTATKDTSSRSTSIVINSSAVYTLTIAYRISSEYQEVAYIESSNSSDFSAYFNTGISANTIGRGVIHGRILGNKQYSVLFGATNKTNEIEANDSQTLAYRPYDGRFFVSRNGSMGYNTLAVLAGNDIAIDFTVANNSTHDVSVTVNSNTVNSEGTIGSITSNSLWLFNCNYNNAASESAYVPYARVTDAKFYSFMNQNTLLADIIPCYRKSDSLAGLWNIVSQQFIPPSGNGFFNVGPDVNA